MSKLVYNYGNNDVLFNVIIDGKQIKEYKLWTSMLQRCYSKTFQDKNPTYIDCKVCDEWLKFSNFYSYCQQNKQWLGYDTFTTEVEFAYHTSLSGEETEVVLLLTEDNKPSQKVKFKVEISTE